MPQHGMAHYTTPPINLGALLYLHFVPYYFNLVPDYLWCHQTLKQVHTPYVPPCSADRVTLLVAPNHKYSTQTPLHTIMQGSSMVAQDPDVNTHHQLC